MAKLCGDAQDALRTAYIRNRAEELLYDIVGDLVEHQWTFYAYLWKSCQTKYAEEFVYEFLLEIMLKYCENSGLITLTVFLLISVLTHTLYIHSSLKIELILAIVGSF